MKREVGIALLGVGWMGRLHSIAYRRVHDHYPECEAIPRLVIAADDVASRRELARELGYEQVTSDWRDALAHPEVQAVSITAPNHMHREMAIAAAEAGKHFWGEKPLGRFPQETAEIAAAVAAAGIRTIVGFNYRHPPAVQYAQQLIACGELGELRRYQGRLLVDFGSDPRGVLSWRFLRDFAGLGALGDLMSHVADMAQFLAGPIARVTAQAETFIEQRPKVAMGSGTHFAIVEGGELGEVENEDSVVSLVEFESGLRGTLEATRALVGRHVEMAFDVHGTKGALSWDFQRMNELGVYLPLKTGDEGYANVFMSPGHPDFARFQPGPAVPMSYDDLKVIEAHLFLESVLDGRQRSPGVEDMLQTAKVLDAMVRSVASGRWENVRELAPPAV